MQSIVTKYLCPTNFKGARIRATCARGSITVSYPHELSGDACHVFAANALVAKFVKEDASATNRRYVTPPNENPWNAPRVCGELPSRERCHTFLPNTSVGFSTDDASELYFMLRARGASATKTKLLKVLKKLDSTLASQVSPE